MRAAIPTLLFLTACATSSAGAPPVKEPPPPDEGFVTGQVEGKLDGVTQARLELVKQCYQDQLRFDPKLSGQVVIHWIIDGTGHVPSTDVESNTTNNDALAACIRGLVAGWSFPRPYGGHVEVSFPFVFSPPP